MNAIEQAIEVLNKMDERLDAHGYLATDNPRADIAQAITALQSMQGEAKIPVRGIVTGTLPTKKVIEVSLEACSQLPARGDRVFIASEQFLQGIGVSGKGHNADWCAGWNAKLLVGSRIEPVTYEAMLTASGKGVNHE
jgi:hypothetical protein